MAAGLGSRYGGLKQIDPIDKNNQILLDYSMYDAHKVGIEKVVCIIKKENKEIFDEIIAKKLKGKMQLEYAYQEMKLPEAYSVPEGRIKPFGTAHAVLSAKEHIDSSFIAINADDFYGRDAFAKMYDFLSTTQDQNKHAMIAYELGKTLSKSGHVARGVCSANENEELQSIVERTKIESFKDGGLYTEDDIHYTYLDGKTPVSMNFWGFQQSMINHIEEYFPKFLDTELKKNPLKCEYFLPLVPNLLIQENKASVKMLKTSQEWFGVTYKEDKPYVQKSIQKMIEDGIYPEKLW